METVDIETTEQQREEGKEKEGVEGEEVGKWKEKTSGIWLPHDDPEFNRSAVIFLCWFVVSTGQTAVVNLVW